MIQKKPGLSLEGRAASLRINVAVAINYLAERMAGRPREFWLG
jgi:hypothetical protein